MHEDLGFIGNPVRDLMEAIGEPGAGIAIAIENLFPPIPSEVILPLAGFFASPQLGTLNVWLVILWTTIGSVVGALALYGIGAWLGHDRMVWLAEKLPLVDGPDVEKTVAWFHRHGKRAVFFGRFIPIFRSLISIPAGIERMPLPVFALLTLAGSGIWNTLFVFLGYFLGEQYHLVEQYTDVLQYIVIALVLIAVAWFVIVRVRKYRAGVR